MRSIGILVSLLFAMAGIAPGQGIITTMAGAPFASCGALGDGGPGHIYFYDYANARIRQITPPALLIPSQETACTAHRAMEAQR
jgi:hypothetical protein